jgi:hypothetical protein
VLDPRRVFHALVKYLCQVSFEMILRHQKYQRQLILMTSTPRTSIMRITKPDFNKYGNNAKNEVEDNQDYLDE